MDAEYEPANGLSQKMRETSALLNQEGGAFDLCLTRKPPLSPSNSAGRTASLTQCLRLLGKLASAISDVQHCTCAHNVTSATE